MSRGADFAWVIAPVSGRGRRGVGDLGGLAFGMARGFAATSSAPPLNAAVIDDLAARVAGIEAKISKPAAPAPDPAMANRVEALEKSVASLRGDLSGLRAQSEKLAAGVNDVKSAPRVAAPSVDLSAINERIAQLERATRAQVSRSRRKAQSQRTTCRFAASSRQPCSTFRCGRANLMSRRWRRRSRWRRTRTP